MTDDKQDDVQKILQLAMQDPDVFSTIAMVMCRAMAMVSHIGLKEPLDESMAGSIEEAATLHGGGIHNLLRRLRSPEADDFAKSVGWRDGVTLRRFVMNGIPPRTN